MEGGSNRVEPCKQFLDLISHEGGKFVRDRELFGISEERKLELRLGPPGDWLQKESKNTQKIGDKEESLLCLGYFSKPHQNTTPSAGAKRGFSDSETGGRDNQKLSPCVPFPSPWTSSAPASSSPSPFPSAFQKIQQQQQAFLHFQNLPVFGKESSQTNGTKVELQNHEKRASPPDSAPAKAAVANKNIQTRNVTGPVVGWPPVRSFRKNIASSSSKHSTDSLNGISKITNKLLDEHTRKGLFVKINMDGVPIGRKVDLKAYNSYEKLSIAVDELFRGLLAAQRDSIVAGNENTAEKNKAITGLLDGSGEFTLVYEDNEGDRMLVGDIPWEMFVTTVKRLRVLKTSELSALSFTNKQVKLAAAACGAA